MKYIIWLHLCTYWISILFTFQLFSNKGNKDLRSASMNTYVFFEELLLPENLCQIQTDSIHGNFYYYCEGITEASIYSLLTKNPLKQSVNYLAVPWTILTIFSLKGIDKSIDNFMPNLKLDGGFTICYHLLNPFKKSKIFSILKKIGINCVFSPGASVDELEYMGIRIEPLPYFSINETKPNNFKDIWYSFIGKNNMGKYLNAIACRNKIFSMSHPSNTFIKKRQCFFPNLQNNEKFESMMEEYKNILSRSRFSLCPRGQQPNSIRFWESLQAGAIPVLISDSARLPNWFDWSSCIIRVDEKDVEKIPEILNKISQKDEKKMRKNCLKAAKIFSGENLVSTIRMYYKEN